MNSRAQLVRRLSHDFWQRLRIALGNSGEGANQHVDRIEPALIDHMAGDVCATLGIDYEVPEDRRPPPAVKGTDKAAKARAASSWKRGINASPKRPDLKARD